MEVIENWVKASHLRKEDSIWWRKDNIMETFSQKKWINEDLQNFWLTLFHMENQIKRAWLDKALTDKEINDDTYRCFLRIYDFINAYKVDRLEKSAHQYRNLHIEEESKLIILNKTKREQVKFLKESINFLLNDINDLKEKLKKESLISLKGKIFNKPVYQITSKENDEMRIFLNEFPSRLNTINDFLKKVYILWSKETKIKLEEWNGRKESL